MKRVVDYLTFAPCHDTAAKRANSFIHTKNAAHTASMRCVSRTSTGQRVLAAGTVVLATLVGCSDNQPPPQDTTVVFDGETYTIHAPVNCAMAGNGRLGIGANTERGKKLIAVSLTRDPPLVVYSVGFRHFDVRGYTNNSNEVSATKVDNTYTISGRMPPEEGEKEGHRFEFEVSCPKITEYAPEYHDRTRIPRPPRPQF